MRMGRLVLSAVLGVTTLAALGTPARAATTVHIDCDAPTGLTIDAAGTYVLGAAVRECESNTAISITASDVTLDLRSFLIDGDDAGATGIRVEIGANRVVVRNGSIRDFFTCVTLRGHRGRASGLTVASCQDGINTDGTQTLITGNTATDNDLVGIATDAGSTIANNDIVGRFGAAPGLDVGILASGEGNTIKGNRVTASTVGGILMNLNAKKNLILRNVVHGTQGSGIASDLADEQTIIGNKVTGGAASGILVDTANVVRENVVKGNAGEGLRAEGTGNRFIENKANGNGADGIEVINDVTTKVSRNIANGNGGLGIRAGGAVRGGGNKAKGNANTAQCDPTSLCN